MMTVPRITLVLVLLIGVIGGEPVIDRTVIAAGFGDSRFVTASHAARAWSPDQLITASANRALVEFATLSPSKQRWFASVAIQIGKLRRAALAHLIQRDPKEALRLSLTSGQRQGLPKYIHNLLEARLHTVGDLTQSIGEFASAGSPNDPQVAQPPAPVTSWRVRIGQTTRRAFVYGLRLRHQAKFDTPVHGIALDDLMAIDESPLYLYDEFETIQLGFQPGQIVATDGHLPIPLPDFPSYAKLRQQLIDQLLLFGPRPLPFNLYAWTTGVKRVLIVKADYRDRTGQVATDTEILNALETTSAFYEANSQGRTSLVPMLLPAVLRMPLPLTTYDRQGTGSGSDAIIHDATELARRFDMDAGDTGMYDPDAYDFVIVTTPLVFAESSFAAADLGGRVVVATGPGTLDLPTLAHELGHAFGFIHSAFWSVPYGADPVGPGTRHEYGDVWDMMGINAELDMVNVDPSRRHFNAFFKTRAGWLPASAVANGTAGGSFRLYRHDATDARGLRAIWIDSGSGTTYWLGIRRQFPWNPSMANGIEVRRVVSTPDTAYGLVELLDMDHLTLGVGGSIGHSLVRLRTFDDAPNGIHIQVGGVWFDEIGEYADVVITRTP